MIGFRAAEQKDAHYLIDIDIKCFDYAWTPEDWRQIAKDCVACVATWNGTPVGMAIFYNDHAGSIEIVKIAVKKPYRNSASLVDYSTTAPCTHGNFTPRDCSWSYPKASCDRVIPRTSASGSGNLDSVPKSRCLETSLRSTENPKTALFSPYPYH